MKKNHLIYIEIIYDLRFNFKFNQNFTDKKKVYMDVLITRINKMDNNKIIIFEIVSSSECYSALL